MIADVKANRPVKIAASTAGCTRSKNPVDAGTFPSAPASFGDLGVPG
jgi:hypothetical protein